MTTGNERRQAAGSRQCDVGPPPQIYLALGKRQQPHVAGQPVILHQGGLDLWVPADTYETAVPVLQGKRCEQVADEPFGHVG